VVPGLAGGGLDDPDEQQREPAQTSCRNTNNSTSLADVLRPSSKTSLSIWRKIKYSSRSDTAVIMPDCR
jgi:hypothetical protein